MKHVRYILGIIVYLLVFVSCNDESNVHLGDYAYVRLDNTTFNLITGEQCLVRASVNGLDDVSLKWTVKDNNVATIEKKEGTVAVITALSKGNTLLKVETDDGKYSYYADILVSEGTPAVKILSVSNGINGVDAISSYLRDIVLSTGKSLEIGIAYVNNASLADHLVNGKESAAVYNYNFTDINGTTITQTGKTLRTLLMSDTWDYIVFEESMPLSGISDGYTVNLPELLTMTSSVATNPDVRILLHQPWAYGSRATDTGFGNYDWDQKTMYQAIVDATAQMLNVEPLYAIIPTGTAIQNARTSYLGESVLSDNVHLSSLGKFMAACTWYEVLFGEQAGYKPAEFVDFDCRLAFTAAHTAVETPNAVTTMTDFEEKLNEFVLDCPIYIDFGPVVSPDPYNNYTVPTEALLGNLKDEKGNPTAFDLAVTSPFSGVLDRGLINELGFPTTASQDMFFCDGIRLPEATMRLSNLNKEMKYTFIFYGNINDKLTQTLYTVTGKNESSATLVNDDNLDRFAIIEGIEPSENADIIIKLGIGPENQQWAKFYGINVLLIVPDGYNLPFEK